MEHPGKIYSSSITHSPSPVTDRTEGLPQFDLQKILGIFSRQKLIILGAVSIFLLLAISYLMIASPKYTATASIMIDTRRVQLFQQSQDAVVSDAIVDTAAIDSQVEILKSEEVGREVIRRLKLSNNDEQTSKSSETTSGIFSTLFGEGDSQDDQPGNTAELKSRTALKRYMKDVQVKRAGTSYVIEVSYRAKNPQIAADVANEIITVYSDDEIRFKTLVVKRTTDWLEGRIAQLREQASAADRELQNFKSSEGLMDANGRPIDEQQLSELTTQLAAAQLEAVQSKARYDRIVEVVKSGVPDASVADSLKNDVIVKLRQEYNDTSRRQAEFEQRYGATHQATEQLRAQMRQTQRQLREELGRIAEAYNNDYKVAQSRLEDLNKSKEVLYKKVSDVRLAQVQARELESKSQSLRAMHDSFLQRYVQAIQQLSSPTAETRVVAKALPPLDPSSPNKLLILSASLMIGTVLGFAGAYGKEVFDTSIRTRNQAALAFRASCLGLLPTVDAKAVGGVRLVSTSPRQIEIDGGLYGYSVKNRSSLYCETIRHVKYAVDLKRSSGVGYKLGISSIGEGEGKTTFAINLAMHLASIGHKVLLVDCDFKRPGLSRALFSNLVVENPSQSGQSTKVGEALWTEVNTQLNIFPVPSGSSYSTSDDFLSSGAFGELMTKISDHYDFIIVDLPPVAPVVDVKVMTSALDGILMVCQWGRHQSEVVSNAISESSQLRSKIVGVVLSRVDLKQYRSIARGEFEYTDTEYFAS